MNEGQPATPAVPPRRHRLSKTEMRWVLLGCSIGAVCSYVFIFADWEPGSKADWFAGLGSFAAVAVALWQSVVIRHQADADAVAAAQRFTEELGAAEARSAAELAAQKQLARVERLYRHEREIKSALVEVARAVSEYGIVIASFWVESVDISKLSTRPEREVAFRPISRMLGEAVSRIAIECDTAELLIENQKLGEAVADLRVAVEAVVWATDEMRQRVERNDNPNMAPVHAAQFQMVEHATETRRLAWELLRTGVDEPER